MKWFGMNKNLPKSELWFGICLGTAITTRTKPQKLISWRFECDFSHHFCIFAFFGRIWQPFLRAVGILNCFVHLCSYVNLFYRS